MSTDEKLDLLLTKLGKIEAQLTNPTPAPVIDRRAAMALVNKKSPSAFDRWANKHGIKPVAWGRYSRVQINLALAREACRPRLQKVPA